MSSTTRANLWASLFAVALCLAVASYFMARNAEDDKVFNRMAAPSRTLQLAPPISGDSWFDSDHTIFTGTLLLEEGLVVDITCNIDRLCWEER